MDSSLASDDDDLESYVDLEILSDRNLRLVLTPHGAVAYEAILVTRDAYGPAVALMLLLQSHLDGEWELVPPDELHAPAGVPILSDDMTDNSQEESVRAGRVYWYPEFAVKDPLDALLEDGFVVFAGAHNTPLPTL